jgi:signal peptidase II
MSDTTQTRDYRPALLVLSAVVILLDRLSKIWVVNHITTGTGLNVIPGVFRLTHVLNTGAAFSLFADSLTPLIVRNSLIAFSVLAIILVFAVLWRSGRELSPSAVALALILGGAIGNLYDRVRFSYVVDFLEVKIINYHWPDFNIADSCIVIGACLLLIEVFRPQPAADL